MTDNHEQYNLNGEIEFLQRAKVNREVRKSCRFPRNFFWCSSVLLAMIAMVFIPNGNGFFLYLPIILVGSTLEYAFDKKVERIEEEIKETMCEAEDYYHPEYSYALAVDRVNSEENRKYQEALNRQKEANQAKKTLVQEKDWTMDEEINELSELIEDYFAAYRLPPLAVKYYEWDIFFDTLYHEFAKRGIKDTYFASVSDMIRLALADTLVSDYTIVTIENFIEALSGLSKKGKFGKYYERGFTEEEVISMQKRIREKIQKRKKGPILVKR